MEESLIDQRQFFMKGKQVVVENPHAANQYYSSGLPSGNNNNVRQFKIDVGTELCTIGALSSPSPRDTYTEPIRQVRETRILMFQNGIQFNRWIARTQSTTNKNNAFELPTFGVIVGVSPTDVQWKGLTLEEPPS